MKSPTYLNEFVERIKFAESDYKKSQKVGSIAQCNPTEKIADAIEKPLCRESSQKDTLVKVHQSEAYKLADAYRVTIKQFEGSEKTKQGANISVINFAL